ncbi:MAG: M20/M25/M40 family metallo-hydrolase [Bacteroidetes bacterium]|nr:M20/M25/M40 family metallo-hydrolase [Bacteroidota bacterium]
MKCLRIYLLVFVVFIAGKSWSQDMMQIISKTETERIEKYLSSDELEGRKTFSKGIDKAAAFIANEFSQAGLATFKNSGSYLQSFSRMSAKFITASGNFDGATIDVKNIIVVTPQPNFSITEASGYEVVKVNKEDNLGTTTRKYISAGKNYLVLVDESFAPNFNRLTNLKSNLTENQKSVVFVLSNVTPTKFTIEATHKIETLSLANVVAVIPGKSLSNEYVIFSGHYDHLGINSARAVNGDSIYNGANDDAAGTTAMIMLSKYFQKLNNNERTLVFAAFTAEEVGGFGAQYFSKKFDPITVKAMFNLEMIGTESKWGKNSAYITGYEKTDMGAILQKNLAGTPFTFYPDPYTDQNLFYRSDNATLARLGVPAHTISTSKMDSEPNYHKPSDQFETLDMDNMNEIIKAIAKSAQTIIAGKDTPTRVDTAQLK